MDGQGRTDGERDHKAIAYIRALAAIGYEAAEDLEWETPWGQMFWLIHKQYHEMAARGVTEQTLSKKLRGVSGTYEASLPVEDEGESSPS